MLVGEGELCGLLLQFGELVLVLGDLLEGRLDELSLHVTDGDGEFVDLQVPENDLPLQEEHLPLQAVPLVEVLLADLLELVLAGGLKVGLGSTSLGDHTETFLSLLPEESTELLLPLGGHESLLLGHGDSGRLLEEMTDERLRGVSADERHCEVSVPPESTPGAGPARSSQ